MLFLSIMMAIASTFVFLWLLSNKERLNSKWWELLLFTLVLLIMGIGSVKVFAILEGIITNRDENMSLFGSIILLPIVFILFAFIKKIKISVAFDTLTGFLIIALFFARISCIYNGCCYGKTIGNMSLKYPTRELELIYYLCFFLIYFYFQKSENNKFSGKWYLIYILSYGIIRFIIEFFRYSDQTSLFHIAHVWSGVIILASIFGLILQKSKKMK